MAEINGEKWHGMSWRLPLCAIFLSLSFFLAQMGLRSGNMLTVFACLLFAAASLVAAVITMATVMAEGASKMFLGGLLGNLIFPDQHATRPPPAYSPAEARRMEGRFEEAIKAYEEILAEYPDDGRVHLALMDIAWRDLEDARRAMRFYQRARKVVKDEAYLKEMQQAYEDFAPILLDEYQRLMPPAAKPSDKTRRYLDEADL